MAQDSYVGKRGGAFRFEHYQDPQKPGCIRSYVVQDPGFGGRSTNPHTIHRYSGTNGSPNYICYASGAEPKTLAEAQQKARRWADGNDEYRVTGVSLSDQIKRGKL